MVAQAAEEAAELLLDVGVAAPGAEELEQQEEELRLVVDRVLETGDEGVDDSSTLRAAASGSSRRRVRISASRRTTSTSSRSFVPK